MWPDQYSRALSIRAMHETKSSMDSSSAPKSPRKALGPAPQIRIELPQAPAQMGCRVRVATKHQRTVSDAAYTELAERTRLPLATLDGDLRGAALATGVGTDTQRPFALVIVAGLLTRLLISIFLMPALYALVARPGDRLEV